MPEETRQAKWRRLNPDRSREQSREGMQRFRDRKRRVRDLAALKEISEADDGQEATDGDN
jgi:hypothetical protein